MFSCAESGDVPDLSATALRARVAWLILSCGVLVAQATRVTNLSSREVERIGGNDACRAE